MGEGIEIARVAFGQRVVRKCPLCAAFLTYTTRGIEAATAVHAVGNMFAYAPEAFGVNDVDLAATSVSDLVISLLATVAATAVAYALVTRNMFATTP